VEIVQIKALACQLPKERGVPLSRFSITEIVREIISAAIVPSVSNSSVWRWLHEDAIRPWFHESWINPRDPKFIEKAGKVLDLYDNKWESEPLGPRDYIISSDEKTSIQARIRTYSTGSPCTGKMMRIEHEYIRGGALTYLAAWDVHRAKIYGRCEPKSGIKPFMRLVDQVMSQHPYNTADRVFWIVDNGSSHRGQSFSERLKSQWKNAIGVNLPIHASWLNQIEIYFSIIQRKVLTPNDFRNLDELEERLLNFQMHYQEVAHPFSWKFTRKDLNEKLKLVSNRIIQFNQTNPITSINKKYLNRANGLESFQAC